MKAFLDSLHMNPHALSRASARFLLVLELALLPVLGSPSFAGAGGVGAPGEGIGSLPSGVSGFPEGLVVLGGFEEVFGMLEGATSGGRVEVTIIDPADPLGLIAVSFSGNIDVRFDRAALSASSAAFFYSPGEEMLGSTAQVRSDGRTSLPFDVQGMIALPYGASFSVSGAHSYALQASLAGSLSRVAASSSTSDVVVRVRSN